MSARAKKPPKKSTAKMGCGCLGILVLIVAGIGIVSAISGPGSDASPAPTPERVAATTPSGSAADDSIATATGTFVAAVDGDTVETSEGTVRVIGIDTPEIGQCGYEEASALVSSLFSPGDPVVLGYPDGQNDRDRHERLLRYVATETGTDLGRAQLDAGNAVARYDSVDGYPTHPREDDYRSAQTASLESDGSVSTVACKRVAEEAQKDPVALVPADAATAEQPWYLQYASCAALKRNTAGHPIGPFNRDDPAQSDIYDWFQYGTGHRGDGDGDGWACE